MLGSDCKAARDHRQSIWSLTTKTRWDNNVWSSDLAKLIEDKLEIYTIHDLVERGGKSDFETIITNDEVLKNYWGDIRKAIVFYSKWLPRERLYLDPNQ